MKITPSSRRYGRVMLCFGTAIVLLSAASGTALADPPEISVPDDGSRPEGDPGTVGGDPLPSEGDTPVAGPGVSRGPYANKIGELAKSVATLGQQTTSAEEAVLYRSEATVAAYNYWLDLKTESDQLADLASQMAATKYQDSGSDIQGVSDEFDELFELNPGLLNDDSATVQSEAERAAADTEVAQASMDAALAAEAIAKNDYDTLKDQLTKENKKLEKLIADNADAIAVQEKQNENNNDYHLGDIGTDVDGWRAADKAQAAVRFAVGEIGKPYEWGAEGPNTYDCSGLVQTAYGKQRVTLPRVANDQFRATTTMAVEVSKMLPGDLIFYGDRAGDWTSVYHVGMYIGDGKMVNAPRPGDVVKVVPVWFNDFFGAHRVVAAVKSDGNDGDDDGPSDPGSQTPTEKPTSPSTRPSSAAPTTPSEQTTSGGSPKPESTPPPSDTPTG